MKTIALSSAASIEITAGTVQSATITDQSGTRSYLATVRQRRFFIEVVQADGTRIGLWDRDSHSEEAVRQAGVLAACLGNPVRDCTREACS